MGSPARLEFRALQETGEFSRLVSGLIPAQPTEAVDSSGEVSSLRAKGSLYLFSFTLNSSRRSLILAHFANKESKAQRILQLAWQSRDFKLDPRTHKFQLVATEK